MKIVVIGGSGLIGTKVVTNLSKRGHNVIAGSPSTGINTITGEGLADVMSKTDVVIDLANAPSFEDKAVLEFFETAGRNLLGAEISAGVKHHLALSIVGVDLMQNVGYMRAKKVQEDLIKQSGVPYTIIRSTQFLEFLAGIAGHASEGDMVHISDVQFQPIAADDVAHFVSEAAIGMPINSTIEIAGPERSTMPSFIARYLKDTNDSRKVFPNSNNQYYGGKIPNNALVPLNGNAKLGAISFEKWMSGQLQHS
jgi:uncharacterized protein YbjT (DUF2867 family)